MSNQLCRINLLLFTWKDFFFDKFLFCFIVFYHRQIDRSTIFLVWVFSGEFIEHTHLVLKIVSFGGFWFSVYLKMKYRPCGMFRFWRVGGEWNEFPYWCMNRGKSFSEFYELYTSLHPSKIEKLFEISKLSLTQILQIFFPRKNLHRAHFPHSNILEKR